MAKKSNNSIKKSSATIPSLGLIFIIVATIVSYFPTFTNELIINWDDHLYITDYDGIKKLDFKSVYKLFTSFHYENYHPLTNLTNAIEYSIWELNPLPYHAINLLLHLFNVYLVYLLIKQLLNHETIALVSAAVMGIHPMHVESVAWASERKDVLYAFFFLLSAIMYIKFDRTNERKFYLWSVVLFLCSCLSKSAAVVLPLFLFAINYFNEKRSIRKNAALIPFFALSVLFGYIAILSQGSTGATSMVPDYPWYDKLFLSSYAIVYYVIMFVMPVNLNVLHMYPEKVNGFFPIEYYIAPVILLLLFIFFFKLFKQERKRLLLGFLFFIAGLVLIIQFVPVGRAIVAERYTYIPYIGLSIVVAVVLAQIKAGWTSYVYYSFFVLFCIITFQRVKVWNNGNILFSDAIDKTPNVPLLWYNRGYYKQYKNQDHADALNDFNAALKLDSNYALAYNNRGGAKFFLKDYSGAIADYDKAVALDSVRTDGYYNRGYVKQTIGDLQGALKDYTSSVRVKKENAHVALSSRAVVKEKLNDYDGAIADYTDAIRILPEYSQAYFNRGNLKYSIKKDLQGAASDYKSAIAIDKKYADAYFNLGIVSLDLGNKTEACNSLTNAFNLGQTRAGDLLKQNCR
ncbi:MAG: tetratricopeptide repeat protein [Bacteroidetes bacterium]|nr:tetratricopeptide repeat protein [Bacteroidota bacterium]